MSFVSQQRAMDNLMLEHAFLKAPCEELSKCFRVRQKQLHKELSALAVSAAQLGANPSQTELAPVLTRLASVRSALDSTRAAEAAAMSRCTARLEHLAATPAHPTPASTTGTPAAPWEKSRLDRLLVDYMLRRGLPNPAVSLAVRAEVEPLCDLRLFESARTIEAALALRNVSPALRWCTENKRRLARIGSDLEFRLRLQEVVELVRARRRESAIIYVRAHLVGDPSQMRHVQRVIALLAFPPGTECEPYKAMYAQERWEELGRAFHRDNYKLHGLPTESLLETTVKAGLSTLKTRQCSTAETLNPSCPTCVEPFHSLARDLPRAQHVHSILVCSLSKRIMDEDNPPMALPNGNVYGSSALQQIGALNNGLIRDPKTGDTFQFAELRKCFIM